MFQFTKEITDLRPRYVQILQSNVRQRRRTLQKVMAKSIDGAHESVLLTTVDGPSVRHRSYLFKCGNLWKALKWSGELEISCFSYLVWMFAREDSNRSERKLGFAL